MSGYRNILLERRDRVGIITLNRPEALNALNAALMHEVVAAATPAYRRGGMAKLEEPASLASDARNTG